MKLAFENFKAMREFRKDRDRDGRIRFMAEANNYVMVRRPGCVPFVMTEKEWRALRLWEPVHVGMK